MDKKWWKWNKVFTTQRASNSPWPIWSGALHADEIAFVFGQVFVFVFGQVFVFVVGQVFVFGQVFVWTGMDTFILRGPTRPPEVQGLNFLYIILCLYHDCCISNVLRDVTSVQWHVLTSVQPLNRSKNYNDAEIRLSKKMMTYWANFAKTGCLSFHHLNHHH